MDKEKRLGPYQVTGAYFGHKELQRKVKEREDAIKRNPKVVQRDPESYVLDRLRIRFNTGRLKIEGFSNPPKHKSMISFVQTPNVKDFLFGLISKLNSAANGQNGEVLEEDQDFVYSSEKPESDLPTGFGDEAEEKIDNFFGEEK
jgi:hypothetical protein